MKTKQMRIRHHSDGPFSSRGTAVAQIPLTQEGLICTGSSLALATPRWRALTCLAGPASAVRRPCFPITGRTFRFLCGDTVPVRRRVTPQSNGKSSRARHAPHGWRHNSPPPT